MYTYLLAIERLKKLPLFFLLSINVIEENNDKFTFILCVCIIIIHDIQNLIEFVLCIQIQLYIIARSLLLYFGQQSLHIYLYMAMRYWLSFVPICHSQIRNISHTTVQGKVCVVYYYDNYEWVWVYIVMEGCALFTINYWVDPSQSCHRMDEQKHNYDVDWIHLQLEYAI